MKHSGSLRSNLYSILRSIEAGKTKPFGLFNKYTSDDVLGAVFPTFKNIDKAIVSKNSVIQCHGVNASPGAAKGILALDSNRAETLAFKKEKVILLLHSYSPDDVHGMLASAGLISVQSGATSHAAVVARQFGVPCVVGCSEIIIDLDNRRIIYQDILVNEGDEIAVDGNAGIVYFSPQRKLPNDFDQVSEGDLELLELFVKTVEGIVKSRALPPEGIEFAVLATLFRLHRLDFFEDIFLLKDNLEYIKSLNQNNCDNFLMSLILDTVCFLIDDLLALKKEINQGEKILIRKRITLGLRRLNNIANKAVGNRLLMIFLEKGNKNLDLLISNYQRAIDISELDYPSPNILFVEDEPNFVVEIVQSLRDTLKSNITLATSAEMAIEALLSECPYDLIVTDAIIPMKDNLSCEPYEGGLYFCEKVKDIRGNDLPIICFTVISDPFILKKFNDIGVNLIINKPSLPSVVVNAVHMQLIQRFRILDPTLISNEILKRQMELKSTDNNMKIRALWALLELSRYDNKVIEYINEFYQLEINPKVKTVAKTIIDQLDIRSKYINYSHAISAAKNPENHLAQNERANMMIKYDVFISYKSIDSDWVLKLKAGLLKLNLRVWLDKDEVRPGDLFAMALEKGLEESDCVAIVVSPESVASGWVHEEYYRALAIANSSSRPLRLIPILLRSAILPGFLANRNWIDFRDDSRFNENMKILYWGITGTKL